MKHNNGFSKVYWERNMLALLLANKTPNSGWYYDNKKSEKDAFKRVISIDNGKITFHVHNDFDLGTLPQIDDAWDGHSTKEKWNRIAKICGIPTKEESSEKDDCN